MVKWHPSWQPWISERNDVELGKHIKEYRTARGMSQEDLAQRIYVTRQTVSNWETDKTYPDVESLLLLSVLFDTTVDELIKGDVETMKNCVENDYKKMVQLSWGGLGLAILGCALFIAGLTLWNWDIAPSVIIWLLLWGTGMALIMKCERIKKEHDLVTYQEILAFKKGEPIDRSNRKSRRARQHRVAKIVAITVIAAAVGGVFGYLYAMFFL
ncbi:transcriptional regulator [Rubneribacter badeniensis]|uniref:Transcriptional regulator n=2 Tax=Rubneribacter badeniensis TaxID=2070688 RepID=A0A2K2U348_9ACTN|nr:transcriptional regulator [Rubneribacter badeniensis]